MFARLVSTAQNLSYSSLALKFSFCPLCERTRLFVKFAENDISVRCFTCRASAISLSMIAAIKQLYPELRSIKTYELSSRGPVVKFLRQSEASLTCSEFLHSVAPGEFSDGVQCQDVQDLTYGAEQFELCTSTEVFEHVPDDHLGFSEIYRILCPDGCFIFTVPLNIDQQTVERASVLPNGDIQHLLPAEYHGDPIRQQEPILAFRNYGKDIIERLLQAGFSQAEFIAPYKNPPWGYARHIIIARKGSLVLTSKDEGKS